MAELNDGEARHSHSGPPPEAGTAVCGIREAAHPAAQQRSAKDGREALPRSLDCQTTKDQPRPPHPNQVTALQTC